MKLSDHLQYELTQGSHVFQVKINKSCTRSICADVSGDFERERERERETHTHSWFFLGKSMFNKWILYWKIKPTFPPPKIKCKSLFCKIYLIYWMTPYTSHFFSLTFFLKYRWTIMTFYLKFHLIIFNVVYVCTHE